MATAICLLGLSVMAYAQDAKVSKTRYYRHEVGIGGGRMFFDEDPMDDYINHISNAFPVYEEEYSGLFKGTAGKVGSYYYHFNEWLSIGAIAAYTGNDCTFGGYYKDEEVLVDYDYAENGWIPVYVTKKVETEGGGNRIKEKSLFIMPSVKLSWLNNNWCSLYTKALIGWRFQWLRFKSHAHRLMNLSMSWRRKEEPTRT